LKRGVDASGLANWTGLLNQGVSRNQVVQDIEASLEFRSDQVTAIYSQFLHRAVDPSGMATFTNFLANGGTVEQVEAMVVGSPEYFQNRGGGTNNGFLKALYQDGLNRTIDPTGQATFGMDLAMGVTPGQVASAVFSSTEFLQDTVQGFYNNLLHRAADPTGLSSFVNALQTGATDQQVIAAIAGSSEFFANV
jgi:hypothetical protein